MEISPGKKSLHGKKDKVTKNFCHSVGMPSSVNTVVVQECSQFGPSRYVIVCTVLRFLTADLCNQEEVRPIAGHTLCDVACGVSGVRTLSARGPEQCENHTGMPSSVNTVVVQATPFVMWRVV